MIMKRDVERDRVLEQYHYNPETGVFTHLFNKGGTARAGTVAGGKELSGCIRISVDGQPYKAHRLAWLIVYGVWPEGIVDHINRDPSDNRICNLREANRAENMHNRTVNTNNKSREKGVHFCKRDKRWIAQVRINNTATARRFATMEEASEYARQARESLHGEFVRHV